VCLGIFAGFDIQSVGGGWEESVVYAKLYHARGVGVPGGSGQSYYARLSVLTSLFSNVGCESPNITDLAIGTTFGLVPVPLYSSFIVLPPAISLTAATTGFPT
jgi:hypothetical protein